MATLPLTRATDTTLKRHAFEQAGVPAYWLLDTQAPSLTALELRAGSYAQTAAATGAEPLSVTSPFAVTLVPAHLIS